MTTVETHTLKVAEYPSTNEGEVAAFRHAKRLSIENNDCSFFVKLNSKTIYATFRNGVCL